MKSKNIIFNHRSKRERPSLDNKCLLSWNSLTATAFIQSSIALNNSKFLEEGLNLLKNIFKQFKSPQGYFHVLTNGQAKIFPFVDDLGFLLETSIEALLLTGCENLLDEILNLVKIIHKNYVDPISGTLYFSKNETDLINRPIKPEDNVIYSANSAIFGSLTKLILWLGSSNNYNKISITNHKMIESLALISVSNTVILAQKIPTACSQMLQKIKCLEHKNTIIINNNNDNSTSLSIAHLAYSTCIHHLNDYCVIGSILNTKYDLANIHEYIRNQMNLNFETEYSFCNAKGCMLPTKNLSELFLQNKDS